MDLTKHSDIAAIAIMTPLTYAIIILFIRLSGKRSTSQMNNFDWVVTVTLGSISASTILLDEVTLVEGALAMALLLFLQFLLTSAVRRFEPISRLVKARPATLYKDGEWQDRTMSSERISRSEVVSAVRSEGLASLDQVDRVILETDATMSVIPRS